MYAAPTPTPVFISAINFGLPQEGITVSGPPGTDLIGWTLEVYDAQSAWQRQPLSGVIQHQGLTFQQPPTGIKKSPAGGVMLRDAANRTAQFLSWGGKMAAPDGAVSDEVPDVWTPNPLHKLFLDGQGTKASDLCWRHMAAPQTTNGMPWPIWRGSLLLTPAKCCHRDAHCFTSLAERVKPPHRTATDSRIQRETSVPPEIYVLTPA